MTDEEALAEILAGLRARLSVLATSHGAELREAPESEGYGVNGTRFVLHPTQETATPVSVFTEDAHTVWVEFGLDTVDEIFTSPKQVARAVDDVLEVVEAVAAGRARQRLWYSQTQPEPIGAEAWVQLHEGGKWISFQSWGRVPLRVLQGRYRAEDVQYSAYS